MSDFSILGGPPSERDDGSNETDDSSAETNPSIGTDADADGVVGTDPRSDSGPRTEPLPGDAVTAVHRGRLYSLLALGLDRPGDALEAALADGEYVDRLAESAAAFGDDVETTAVAVGETGPERRALRSQWASLFGVEEGLTVSPYELTYLPGPLLTNVRQLADIRGFYDAFDLEVGEAMPYRGDHVCYLTEFLAQLSLREAHLRRIGDDEGVAVVVDARGTFLEDHLGRWYWRFAGDVSARDDGFYAALTDLLAALLEAEMETLELNPEWVPDDPEVTEWNEDVFGDTGRGCGGCGGESDGVDGSNRHRQRDVEPSAADEFPQK